jgi:hypothetical protein
MEKKSIGLDEVLNKYGVPDPKIVGKLPKGGQQLSFVGHADVTKMLLEVDSGWTWEPVAFDADGLPAYRVENGMAHMAGWMTVHGVRRLGVGSCLPNKPDLMKELISDLIRNCAMRFGFCLSLWTKQEWEDLEHSPAHAPNGPVPNKKDTGPRVSKAVEIAQRATAKAAAQEANAELSEEQRNQFVTACTKANLDPEVVAKNAGLDWTKGIKEADLGALRESFKDLKAFQEGA